MNTELPGIWLETLKYVENEKRKLQDLDCGEKTEKHGKLDKQAIGSGIWRENGKHGK